MSICQILQIKVISEITSFNAILISSLKAINERRNADSSSDAESLKSRMLKKVSEMKFLGLAA